jgi:hypothetical protein
MAAVKGGDPVFEMAGFGRWAISREQFGIEAELAEVVHDQRGIA